MMRKHKLLFVLLFMLLVCCNGAFSQDSAVPKDAPFYKDIQDFKMQDKLQPQPKHAILFVGSSSFTMWKDVAQYFSGYTIINRGFGGSSLPDLLRYEKDIIFPYKPRQVVIYCGENDFAASDTVTSEMVFNRFKQLFADTRHALPKASIVFVSIKPSPSRRHLQPKIKAANALIKEFIEKEKNTAFVNVYDRMLTPEGAMVGQLYLADSLHMNARGYEIWQKAIQPYLLH